MQWLCSMVNSSGSVRCNDTNYDDVLIAARTAEALALTKNPKACELAKSILNRLTLASVDLGEEQAAIRASACHTGLRTEHTIAALAAFACLQEASS